MVLCEGPQRAINIATTIVSHSISISVYRLTTVAQCFAGVINLQLWLLYFYFFQSNNGWHLFSAYYMPRILSAFHVLIHLILVLTPWGIAIITSILHMKKLRQKDITQGSILINGGAGIINPDIWFGNLYCYPPLCCLSCALLTLICNSWYIS